jgi:hypothetical protein
MALSVSCCMGTEVSVPDLDRCGKIGSRSRGPGDLRVCGLRADGAECAAGSRASSGDDPAEGINIRFVGSVEGTDFDEAVPPVSVFEEEAVLGQSFLGQGILCGHSGIGCGHDMQVCPLPGEEGAAVGATTIVRLEIIPAARLLWPAPSGGRALSPLWGDFPKPHP